MGQGGGGGGGALVKIIRESLSEETFLLTHEC